MVKRPRLDHWSFSYELEKQEDIFLCNVPNLVVGMSEISFEDAVDDARNKLYHIPNLPYSHCSNGIKIHIETYMNQQNETSHIFL